jgi:serine/threonine protein kinase
MSEERDTHAPTCSPIAYLHYYGVVHRDIKPENILLTQAADAADPFDLRISDFGLACFTPNSSPNDTSPGSLMHTTQMEVVAGTPMYMAPEMVARVGYSSMCDVWSIGVMMWLFMAGFYKDAELALLHMIQEGRIEYPEEFWKEVTPCGRCDFACCFVLINHSRMSTHLKPLTTSQHAS